mmetsp:Transcript_91452/g.254690  ORF Transcript_91452/g.254690 Transcript_91452/m.254690 type:complete len:483 (-) Transcript_91452:1196-2644(-)
MGPLLPVSPAAIHALVGAGPGRGAFSDFLEWIIAVLAPEGWWLDDFTPACPISCAALCGTARPLAPILLHTIYRRSTGAIEWWFFAWARVAPLTLRDWATAGLASMRWNIKPPRACSDAVTPRAALLVPGPPIFEGAIFLLLLFFAANHCTAGLEALHIALCWFATIVGPDLLRARAQAHTTAAACDTARSPRTPVTPLSVDTVLAVAGSLAKCRWHHLLFRERLTQAPLTMWIHSYIACASADTHSAKLCLLASTPILPCSPLAVLILEAVIATATADLFEAHATAIATQGRCPQYFSAALLDSGATLHVAVRPLAPWRCSAVQVRVARYLVARLGLVKVALARCPAMRRLCLDLPRTEALAIAAADAASTPGCPALEGTIHGLRLRAGTRLLDGTLAWEALTLCWRNGPSTEGLQADLALAAGPIGPLSHNAVHALDASRAGAFAARICHAQCVLASAAPTTGVCLYVAQPLVLASSARR